jgi:hypothetical protein
MPSIRPPSFDHLNNIFLPTKILNLFRHIPAIATENFIDVIISLYHNMFQSLRTRCCDTERYSNINKILSCDCGYMSEKILTCTLRNKDKNLEAPL